PRVVHFRARYLERRPDVIACNKSCFFCTFALPQSSAFCHRGWVVINHCYLYLLAQTRWLVAELKLPAPCVLLLEKSGPDLDECNRRRTHWDFISRYLRYPGLPGLQRTSRYSLSRNVSGIRAVHPWLRRYALRGSDHRLDTCVCVVRGCQGFHSRRFANHRGRASVHCAACLRSHLSGENNGTENR